MKNKFEKVNIKAALTVATAALLGNSSLAQANTTANIEDSTWEFDSAIL